MTSITDALGWLAGAFYVIVALSIVYLFFFRIVPLVLGKITWDIWSLVRGVLVLAALAFLLGCVAIFTADWIFSQVLDTLPRTRMAREVDRVTGSLVRLSVDTGYGVSTASSAPYVAPLAPGGGSGSSGSAPAFPFLPIPGSTPEPGSGAGAPSMQLKSNALQLWATSIQTQYNPTGDFTDNRAVMSLRDIPQGVVCEVALVAGGWKLKQYEEWRIECSMDNFRTSVVLPLNGTAARGLTGGNTYDVENPYPVSGTGAWPDIALEPVAPSLLVPSAEPTLSATPQGGPAEDAPPAAAGTAHRVRPGESLAVIAQRYQVPVAQLVAANQAKYPQLQANPNMIKVGWELAIPEEP